MATPIEQAVEDLGAAVAELTTVKGSVIALVDRFADEFAANADEPAKILELSATMKAASADLAAKVAEHTPAEEEPGPEPEPEPEPEV